MTHIEKSDFNILNEPLYKINKMTLKAFGSWPYQSPTVRASIVFMACFGVLTVVIPEVNQAFDFPYQFNIAKVNL